MCVFPCCVHCGEVKTVVNLLAMRSPRTFFSSREKWQISHVGQEIYKIRLEHHFATPESKGSQANLKKLLLAKEDTIYKQ